MAHNNQSIYCLIFAVADRINICESPIITAQQGYIVTPGYPNNYASNVNCTTQIQVKSYQHLQLYILDLDLEMVNSTCSDYMLAQDTMQTLTLCGKRWNEPSPVSWKNLTIRLSTNGHKNHKGFWLHFRGKHISSIANSIFLTIFKRFRSISKVHYSIGNINLLYKETVILQKFTLGNILYLLMLLEIISVSERKFMLANIFS